MTLIKKRQELPVFGDMMANLFNDKFFEPIHSHNSKNIPSVNIFEDKKEFTIQLAAPGMKKDDFKIDLKKNALQISAKKENNKEAVEGKYSLREFNFSSFQRAFTLPKNIDSENIQAQYLDGILEVKIGKKENLEEKTKTISIN
ncbi:MAG: Hsp20 family protein [Crocinitomix sp.]|nr:Hsp20 family protein [Crocinitomix sp.]